MTYEWKFPENLHSVAWRMSGKFQRTYREACPSSASSHERYYIPHTTPPVHTCTYRQPQRSMSCLRKFTWTLLHAPSHPTRAYMHLPAATDKHVLPPQVHMNVITCPPPDVYKTPRPSKDVITCPPPDVYKTPRPSKGRGPTIYKVLQPIGGLWNLILGSLVI